MYNIFLNINFSQNAKLLLTVYPRKKHSEKILIILKSLDRKKENLQG